MTIEDPERIEPSRFLAEEVPRLLNDITEVPRFEVMLAETPDISAVRYETRELPAGYQASGRAILEAIPWNLIESAGMGLRLFTTNDCWQPDSRITRHVTLLKVLQKESRPLNQAGTSERMFEGKEGIRYGIVSEIGPDSFLSAFKVMLHLKSSALIFDPARRERGILLEEAFRAAFTTEFHNSSESNIRWYDLIPYCLGKGMLVGKLVKNSEEGWISIDVIGRESTLSGIR